MEKFFVESFFGIDLWHHFVCFVILGKIHTVKSFIMFFLLQVIFIKMRRDDTSKFKGSIFVEFATQEMANNFLQQDLAIDESVLEKMTRYE